MLLSPADYPRGEPSQLCETDGRSLYSLMQCLGAIALPRLNELRTKSGIPALVFDAIDMQRNDIATRGIVNEYILGHIEELAAEFKARSSEQLFKRIIERRVTKGDIKIVESWARHVTGTFFVVGHLADGAVLVQLAPPRSRNAVVSSSASREGPFPVDASSAAVFVVKVQPSRIHGTLCLGRVRIRQGATRVDLICTLSSLANPPPP